MKFKIDVPVVNTLTNLFLAIDLIMILIKLNNKI